MIRAIVDALPSGPESEDSSRRGAMTNGKSQQDVSAAEQETEHDLSELRDYVPQDILNISFPAAVRGYDRRAVDAYVKRVNRLIAEVKMSASPRAAVRHALRETQQQVSGLLEQARETADEIITGARREAEAEAGSIRAKAAQLLVNTNSEADALKAEAETLLADARTEADEHRTNAKAEAEDILVRSRLEAENTARRSQAEADERLQQLQVELASLREQTESRMREFQADTTAVWERRQQLLEEIRGTAARLVDVADAAETRERDEPDLLQALEPETVVDAPPEDSDRGDQPEKEEESVKATLQG
jgi:DivIVA domain-containing protein